MAEALPIMWRGQRRLPRRDVRGCCVSMRSLSIHREVAALIRCRRVVPPPVFRCESCGFIWLEDKPQMPDPPSKRADD